MEQDLFLVCNWQEKFIVTAEHLAKFLKEFDDPTHIDVKHLKLQDGWEEI